MAIQFILDNNLSPSYIYTDSKSVLDSLGSNPFSKDFSYLSLDIKKLLYTASSRDISINLIWIPSHCGIVGNEIVDSLAKDASRVGILKPFPIPFTDLYHIVTTNCSQKFYSFLNNFRTNTGLYYFNNFFKKSAKPWFNNCHFSRFHIVSINRIRSNHYSLNYSLHRKNIIDTDSCPSCLFTLEDVNHVIWSCPRFAEQRNVLLNCLKKAKISEPYSVELFLKYSNKPPCKYISNFFKSCNLII